MTRDISTREDEGDLVEVSGTSLLAPSEAAEPTDDVVEQLAQAACGNEVSVLNMAQCHDELAEAGLAMPDINALANALADGRHLREESTPVGGLTTKAWIVAVAGLFVFFTAAHLTGSEVMRTIANVWLAAVLVLMFIGGASAYAYARMSDGRRELEDFFKLRVPIPAVTSRRRALAIVSRNVSQQTLGWDRRQLLKRAREAATDVVGSEVWALEMFDTHRVRVDLVEEVRTIAQRVRVVTSGTTGGNHAPASMHRALIDSTNDRVKALEQYRDQVLAVQHEMDRLRRAELEELGEGRLMEWLVQSGADQGQVTELQSLAAESRAAAATIAETLSAMQPTAARLGTIAGQREMEEQEN
ncbi:hypothetical protein SAMN05428985_1157 [Nocardioides sp. YR527]|uniref:hypothetical protein n=1 Tax=Nocardioides sp. YR527 TaxID=1881028 RepID=UPI00088D27A7|nr:hypothetical protein [Nocardioides sp. YR527]SDL33626.1 hypothetical protein SAMN05428985_1157 [Nocardioides sp. YR527]